MLICLYGPDAYRRRQKLNTLIAEYRAKHSGLTIDNFDLDEAGALERLKNFTASQSLFDASKLAIVSNLGEDNDVKKFLKPYLEDKTTTIIISLAKKPAKEFDFLLKKPALAQEFATPTPNQLAAFLKKEAETRRLKIKPEIFESLAKSYAADTWGAIMELGKIDLGGGIETATAEPDFFQLVQTIKSRRLMSVKLPALAYLLENDDPAKVFNIAAALMDPAGKIKMADYDVAIKSGKLEYEEALLDLVISN